MRILTSDTFTTMPWKNGGGVTHEIARAEEAGRALERCRLCPRSCRAHRLAGETGTCGIGREAVVSSAFPHHGEEGCLRGRRGSGTVFFAGCGLRCARCLWRLDERAGGRA